MTGIPILVDYACTKSAIHALTKSLATYLGERDIRVNCVVPGPVWTPNIPGTMPAEEIKKFGYEVALARPGQPEELGTGLRAASLARRLLHDWLPGACDRRQDELRSVKVALG